ncbi:hypothetical protein [Maritimibacter alexandrii]|uniref:hypothetical protein n=1 Tax=Maritimibacter alexandrii TaxID=2570355 RepID=UPI0011085F0F|nr:hypothetical protein [Maritimibacter alexandrii]
MKVITHTPDLLIVEDRPVFIAIMLIVFTLVFLGAGLGILAAGEWWGLIFAGLGGGMGLLFFAIFVRRVQVVFHRPDRYVEFRRKNVFRALKVRHDLRDVSRAIVERNRSSEGGTTYRVTLVFDTGESAGLHPITFAYSSGSGHANAARAINEWLGAQ